MQSIGRKWLTAIDVTGRRKGFPSLYVHSGAVRRNPSRIRDEDNVRRSVYLG